MMLKKVYDPYRTREIVVSARGPQFHVSSGLEDIFRFSRLLAQDEPGKTTYKTGTHGISLGLADFESEPMI